MYYAVMASAVGGGVITLSLWQRTKNMQFAANNTDDNNMLAIATISTLVANNSPPNIFNVSHPEPRRLMHM